MSKKRHKADALLRTFGVTFSAGEIVPPQRSDWHQLIYASEGVMTVHTSKGSWVVPSHRALWVPADVRYRIDMHGRVAMRTLYVPSGSSRRFPTECCVVNVSPLLRELVLHAVSMGALDREIVEHRRLAGVIFDQLSVLRSIPLQLPMPSEPRASKLAELLLANPSITIAHAARRAGASRRTMERVFRSEVGTTLGRWVLRMRVLSALRRLAAGESVAAVADEVGYGSASAFIAMFKRELGSTPSRYFAAAG